MPRVNGLLNFNEIDADPFKGQSGSPGARQDNLGHQLFETPEPPSLDGHWREYFDRDKTF